MRTSQPIVVGLDFSEGCEAALIRAADFAERLGAPLHLLSAEGTRPLGFQAKDLRADNLQTAGPDTPRLAAPASSPIPEAPADTVGRMGVFAKDALGGEAIWGALDPILTVQRAATAVDGITRYASDVNAIAVAVGTHGRRGMQHLLVGSVAEGVVGRASCPVLVVPCAAARVAPGPSAPILVPIDFTEHDRRALATAHLIATAFSAPVELVHVTRSLPTLPAPYYETAGFATVFDAVPEVGRRAKARLRRFDTAVSDERAAAYHVLSGQPAREITALAEKRSAGLVVMATHARAERAATSSRAGSRRRSLFGKARSPGADVGFIGRVTKETLRRAPCPVLTLR